MRETSKLEDNGFVIVGMIALDCPSAFRVHFYRPEAQSWKPAIYAFRVGGVVLRIGKCESDLIIRMRAWERDVSRALAGEFRLGATNPWEAFEWRKWLTTCGHGEFLAALGPNDRAELRTLERELIEFYDPPLCNDGRCSRLRPAKARRVTDVSEAEDYWRELNLPPVVNLRRIKAASSNS